MKPISISVLTICGIDELPDQGALGVTHVLSLIDPGWPALEAFQSYDSHHRTTLNFHDIIEPIDGKIMPRPEDVAEVLRFGEALAASRDERAEGHLLVHCHMGVSRSTAAMLTLLAQVHPNETEDRLFERLREIRPQAWPNSVMVGYADELLGRAGRLSAALRRHYEHRVRHDPEVVDWMTRLGRRREVEMALS
ncbi:protein-tyrosine-phosphatase [Pelagibius litoralis]|uniref:Protein-tyrosine-phosphatase n=1 Tax=Pelagibius litoralis TaxID=374515 RepID=A0A967EVB2_9PROT|nr:protein-tyrosine-phosphatase [Pelagibius litoralis]NIA68237.1 protein-tyrosine-phosphatase [Pelagibius litoralis]